MAKSQTSSVFRWAPTISNIITADYGDDKIVVSGDAFSINLTASDSLDVTVTMGGKDITDSVYANGTVSIDAITNDVTITATSVHEPHDYRWEFDGSDLACVKGNNTLTKNGGTTVDGVFNKTCYKLENAVVLKHDLPWIVEWKCEGTFMNSGSSTGARIFSSKDVNADYNARYISKSNKNGIVAMGEKTTTGSHNYGIALGDYGIDWTEMHTYRLENRIAADGSNMIYLFVDGVEENTVLDTAVVTLEGNTLVATGIGTAKVKIDSENYEITVTAAPISLLLLIGQSNMEGNEGEAKQSIVCEDGMVYATYGDRYDMTLANATHYALSEGMSYAYYDLLADSVNREGVLNAVGVSGSVSVKPGNPESFSWSFDGTNLVSDPAEGDVDNALTCLGGSVSNGSFHGLQYKLSHSISLNHDREWAMEMKISNWNATAGSMIFSGGSAATMGQPYLYFRPADFFVGFGYYDGSCYHNYGVALKNYDIACGEGSHTYRFVNHIAEDGSNTIWLYADDEEIAPLAEYYVNSILTENGSNGLSGKDFLLTYIGTSDFAVKGCVIDGIRVV